MAVAILVMIIVSIFAVGIGILSFQPAVFELAWNNSFWDDPTINDDILFFRDAMYNASLAIPIFMIAIIVLWAYLTTNRRAEL